MMRALGADRADRLARWARASRMGALTLLVVIVPLALGGVRPWTRALVAGTLAALFALEWAPRAWSGRWPDPREWAWLWIFAAVSALVFLQLSPLPAGALRALGAHPQALFALGDVPIRRLSPDPLATLGWWSSFAAYWVVTWTVAEARRPEVVRLTGVITGLVLFEALYGTYALTHDLDRVLGVYEKRHYLGDATGTFVNHNHFAGLLGLGWPLGLAWLSRSRRRSLPVSFRAALAAGLSLCVGMALVSSHSRLGLAAAACGMVAWLSLGADRGAGVLRGIRLAVPAAALAGAVWIGSGDLAERFLGLADSGERLIVWKALLDLPVGTWVLGAGAASFREVFKTVQPAGVTPSYHHAHNDYLELLLAFGVAGLAVLAAVTRIWWRRVRPPGLGTLQKGALAGIISVAIHSLGDFDLQVPGVALPFWSSVGIALNPRLGR